MSYNEFINNTCPNDNFHIIPCREDGSCCYNSFLISIKKIKEKKIKKNLNSMVIQSKAVKWVIDNKEKYLNSFFSTMEEIVLDNHQIDNFEEYIERYKTYSGKDNLDVDRWGGIPELIALSEIYNIDINVYGIQSYDKKKSKIIKGRITNNKLNKSTRFKLLYATRQEYDYCINILWTSKNNIEHFDSLIKV
jgi:hypothetical protein